MKFLDIRESFNCPYCNQSIAEHLCDEENIIESSGEREKYDFDGFHLYQDDYYVCPICGQKFYVTRGWRSK